MFSPENDGSPNDMVRFVLLPLLLLHQRYNSSITPGEKRCTSTYPIPVEELGTATGLPSEIPVSDEEKGSFAVPIPETGCLSEIPEALFIPNCGIVTERGLVAICYLPISQTSCLSYTSSFVSKGDQFEYFLLGGY